MTHFYTFCAGWFGAFLFMSIASGWLSLTALCSLAIIALATLTSWSRITS